MLILIKIRQFSRLRYALLILFCLRYHIGSGQEIGYNLGLNRLGINTTIFQPLYGFSIGHNFNRHFGMETNFIYSQRSINSVTQADYLSFVLMPKIGFFGKMSGIFYAPAFLLNPTLYHSQIENHTYVSTFQGIGFQTKMGKKLIIDLKLGYDFGLSGAYFSNNIFKTYNGFQILLGMKAVINCEN